MQVERGQSPQAVAEAAGVCARTVRKWVDRYRCEGLAGLRDRSSRPHRLRRPTPQAVVAEIERLQRRGRRRQPLAQRILGSELLGTEITSRISDINSTIGGVGNEQTVDPVGWCHPGTNLRCAGYGVHCAGYATTQDL
uniref:leucine zipper domain-containing protein n=1 Tax=Sinorhizobium chiapasense TaxID=501572 RepID=UPI0038CD1663